MISFNLGDFECKLRVFAKEHGVPMASVVRAALSLYFERPDLVELEADKRTRGDWWLEMYHWDHGDLVNRSKVLHIHSTAEIPAIAAEFFGDPSLEEAVRKDLPRLRQTLARTSFASSARYGDIKKIMYQVDVFRSEPFRD